MFNLFFFTSAKKLSPATAALVKRARSVAVFSLKLRKAREAAAAKNAQQEASQAAKVCNFVM